MDTHSEIVKALGVAHVAAQCGVSAEAVRKWAQRGRIPGPYWLRIAALSADQGLPADLHRIAEIAAQEAAKGA